MSKPICNSTVD